MNEYELKLTVKNAVLLNLMKGRGLTTAAQLHRESGVANSVIGKFLNLTSSPYGRNGKIKGDAEKLAKFFNLPVEFLFPESELYIALDKNVFTAQVSKEDMHRLSGTCPSLILEDMEAESDEAFNGMLQDTVTTREATVLKLRHAQNKSLQEIGDHLGVSSERVRQILLKAERKLRGREHKDNNLVELAGKYNSIY